MKPFTLVSYVLKAAIRDKLIIGITLMLIIAVSLAVFMGATALTEQDRFVAVFAAGSIRILNVFGLVLFVIFFIRRSFETRDVEFMLSRPVSRTKLVLSYAGGFSVIAAGLAIVSGACIYVLSSHLASNGHFFWALSLMAENIIMVNVALFFSMILSSPASCAFICMGFYVLSRMMTQILGIIDSGKVATDGHVLEFLMQIISALMPRLDLMAQTSWLVYGIEDIQNFAFVTIQCVVYTSLIIFAALIDMHYRKF